MDQPVDYTAQAQNIGAPRGGVKADEPCDYTIGWGDSDCKVKMKLLDRERRKVRGQHNYIKQMAATILMLNEKVRKLTRELKFALEDLRHIEEDSQSNYL